MTNGAGFLRFLTFFGRRRDRGLGGGVYFCGIIRKNGFFMDWQNIVMIILTVLLLGV